MARLTKHGTELLRLEYAQARIAYMSDGQIMRNDGNGWKLYKRVKAGVDPVAHAEMTSERRRIRDEQCPSWTRYVKLLSEACSLSKRWKVHTAIQLLGNDIDGIWSELEDDQDLSGCFSCDDLQELAECHELGQQELKAFKARQQADKVPT